MNEAGVYHFTFVLSKLQHLSSQIPPSMLNRLGNGAEQKSRKKRMVFTTTTPKRKIQIKNRVSHKTNTERISTRCDTGYYTDRLTLTGWQLSGRCSSTFREPQLRMMCSQAFHSWVHKQRERPRRRWEWRLWSSSLRFSPIRKKGEPILLSSCILRASKSGTLTIVSRITFCCAHLFCV